MHVGPIAIVPLVLSATFFAFPSLAQTAQKDDKSPAPRAAKRVEGTARETSPLGGLVARHASANGVPVSLVHRVIMRESRYNSRAIVAGNYGLMQIKLGTARTLGYKGAADGLLDPDTNMTYAVRYLAGAYRAAGRDESRAIALYNRGY